MVSLWQPAGAKLAPRSPASWLRSGCVVCEICHHGKSVELRIRWENRDARRGRFPTSPRCLQTACQFYLGTIDKPLSDEPKSQGKETLRYELAQDFDRCGRNSRNWQCGTSRTVRFLLRNRKILWLHLDVPACVLQTRDCSALLPERSHVPTSLLDFDSSLLQAELLRMGSVKLLQESLRFWLWKRQWLWKQRLCSKLRSSGCLCSEVLCSGCLW